MRHFSIKEFEQLSGIKAHTIRIWEQRYALFTPQRTEANLRRYSLPELRLLLDISLLIRNGHKISKLAVLQPEDLAKRVMALKDNDARKDKSINDLIYAMYTSNMEDFELVMEGALLSWGGDMTIRHLIIPFLEKAQLLSYRNNSAEAHFVITAVRRKLILGIESLHSPATDYRSVLLFLPKEEHYDLMLLYTFYMLKKAGLKPLYLGTDISLANLEKVCNEKQPSLLFTYSCVPGSPKLDSYQALIGKHLPGARLYVVCADVPVPLQDTPVMQQLHYRELDTLFQQVTA